ncbi:hypothetical protein [Hyphomonas sp.]|uniref:hypothetical protein n=1 Tax=Hyphomonas sp. TaxID=87 RepID=UPI003528365E
MRRLAKAGALGLIMSVIIAAPANAQAQPELDCEGGLVGSLLKAVEDVRYRRAKLDDLLPAFDGAAARCPDNTYALHYAAVAHLTKAQTLNTEKAGADAIMPEIEKAFTYSQAFWALPDRDRKYTVAQNDFPVEKGLSYVEQSDLRTSLISSLLDMHVRAGKTHPYLSSEEAPETCGDVQNQDVSAAGSWFVRNEQFGHAAVPFAERLASACEMTEPWSSIPNITLKSLANSQLIWARNIVEEDPETARDLVEKVKVFRDAVLEPGETSNSIWRDFNASDLEKVEKALPQPIIVPTDTLDPLVSPGPVPVEDWFSEAADDAKVMESMGRTMDAYVAARGRSGYNSVIAKMFGATVHTPDRKAACNLIYRAVAAYQQGSWRSEETADVEVPMSSAAWLENWEPPPAPTPATDSQ